MDIYMVILLVESLAFETKRNSSFLGWSFLNYFLDLDRSQEFFATSLDTFQRTPVGSQQVMEGCLRIRIVAEF